jgi:hypothetical protein
MTRRAWGWPLAALLLAALWWQWRVERTILSTALTYVNFDLYAYYYPTTRFAFRELFAGHWPLWNPYQLAGEPFFANQQHGLLYPLNALFLVLPPATAFKWTAIVHVALGLCFSAYLGRVLGLSRAAAWLAAIVFTFGYGKGLLYSRTTLYGAIWLPLAFACAVRIVAEPTRAAPIIGLAVTLACQFLGGYPAYGLLTGYCLAAFALWQSALLARRRAWRELVVTNLALATSGVVAVGLTVVQLLPMLEMTALSPRRLGSLPAQSLTVSTGLDVLRWLFVPFPDPNPRYVGAATLPFALCALIARGQRGRVAFFLLLGALGAVLAAGPATPLFSLYARLPASNWFRFPSEFVFLTVFGLASAAGIGAQALIEWRDGAVLRRATLAFVGAVLIALTLRLGVPGYALPLGRRAAVALLAVALPGLWLASAARRVVVAIVLAAVWLDLVVASRNVFIIPDVAPSQFEPAPEVIRFLRERADRARIYLHGTDLQAPLVKTGMDYQLFTIADHESLLPFRYAKYAAFMAGGAPPSALIPPQGHVRLDRTRHHRRLLDLLGVRYIVGAPGDSVCLDCPVVFRTASSVVRENTQAYPRAFVVGATEVVATDQVLARLVAPDFDPRAAALIEDHGAMIDGGEPAGAEIVEYAAEHVVVRIDTRAAGLLVLTDQYYPGWQARLDGASVPIVAADYIFRGVPVPAGRHTVAFEYRPTSLYRGALISALTVSAVLLWLMVARRRAAASRR